MEGVTATDHPRWHVSVASSGTATLTQTGASRKPPGPPRNLRANATKEEIDAFASGVALPVKHEVVPVPYWSRTSTPPTESEYEAPGVMEDARGWPMRSMVWHLVRRKADAPERHLWSLDLGGMQGPVGLPRALPLRPIPIGFVVNSLLYATCLWLMISVPFDVRRMIRCKRGRCTKCGYDLSGTDHEACPECGVSLPKPPALPGQPDRQSVIGPTQPLGKARWPRVIHAGQSDELVPPAHAWISSSLARS